MLMGKPGSLLRDRGVELQRDECHPPLLELSRQLGELPRRDASFPSRAGECRMAFDVRDPAGRRRFRVSEEVEHKLPSILNQEGLHKRAGVQIDAQDRSSLTYEETGGPGLGRTPLGGGLNLLPDQLARPSARRVAMFSGILAGMIRATGSPRSVTMMLSPARTRLRYRLSEFFSSRTPTSM